MKFIGNSNPVKHEDDVEIGGKEVGAVQFTFDGDVKQCQALVGIARNLLGNLKRRLQLGGLMQGQDQKELKGGGLIVVNSVRGLADIDKAYIRVVVRDKLIPEGSIKCLGYIVQAFVDTTYFPFVVELPSKKIIRNDNVYIELLATKEEYIGYPENGCLYFPAIDFENAETDLQQVIIAEDRVKRITTGLGANTAHVHSFVEDPAAIAAGSYDQPAYPYLYSPIRWGDPIGGTTWFNRPSGVTFSQFYNTYVAPQDVINLNNAFSMSYEDGLGDGKAKDYDYGEYLEIRSYPFNYSINPIYKHKEDLGFITGSGVLFDGDKIEFTAANIEYGQGAVFMMPDSGDKKKYHYSIDVKNMPTPSSSTQMKQYGDLLYAPAGINPASEFSPDNQVGWTMNPDAEIESSRTPLFNEFGIPVNVEQGIHTITGNGGSGYYHVHLLISNNDNLEIRILKVNDITDGATIKIQVGDINNVNEIVSR